ncbi:unnamed protein product [Medioppia subpectinata]|uniref:Uncharacterized protein n=1 Tax=Medioppia subpectinata TaxID=1979941 RepID=A0A7R9LDD3_9ACAR|nr:unnamed protein product [Medioppia subpectinata]CAG2117800.1 unnamed protein product [Medioppia subpectinata]
MVQIIYIRE